MLPRLLISSLVLHRPFFLILLHFFLFLAYQFNTSTFISFYHSLCYLLALLISRLVLHRPFFLIILLFFPFFFPGFQFNSRLFILSFLSLYRITPHFLPCPSPPFWSHFLRFLQFFSVFRFNSRFLILSFLSQYHAFTPYLSHCPSFFHSFPLLPSFASQD